MVKSILIRIGIVLIGVLVVVVGRGLFFYSGFYTAPPGVMPSYESVVVPPIAGSEFSDEYKEREGIILFDLAHDNAFDKEELNVLMLRLVSRGMTIKFLSAEDDLERELLGKEEAEDEEEEPADEEENLEEEAPSKEKSLEEEIEVPVAFVVVCPRLEFSREEGEAVVEFLDNGGRLLLIADPTRHGKMNSLSINLGLIFEPDYLYNMKENEINYRNIFVSEFEDNSVTEGLAKIALYAAGSISSADSGIAFVDQNTFSSVVETRNKLSPMALSREAKVLAIYDLTFMTEPYNGVLDNNQLLTNIADWLASP